jgi:hypothetical protein
MLFTNFASARDLSQRYFPAAGSKAFERSAVQVLKKELKRGTIHAL